ncbi:hypothetical protein L6164_019409 [Bauhinia variegata]|uniref:Uncharacterized protein n=1 Tax=Bauhinia variegata TaxID=167791 RepID=A0ACB9MWG9_BAUVA|nr:hypothetical protein L6164_019409 [Bauhinia variegata]
MDAVGLPLPVDVAAPAKLMGSEGFVRARVTVKETEGRGSDRVSIFVSRSIECCNSPHSEDAANLKNDKELPSQDNFQETELCNNSSQPHHIQNEEVSKNVHGKGRNRLTSRLEGVPSQRKAGKLNRNYSSSSKRIRMSQSEDSSSLNGIEDSKDISDRPGSQYIKYSSLEKSHLPKQKSCATKRGDRRNFKVPAKAKFDSSSMKLGARIFSSSCGGNNFFGLYGLKHDIHDVTKLVNEPTLDELLRGTFDYPSLSKDKGKKASNMNESLLDSARKACSILQMPKCVQSQNVADTDSPSNKKMSACHLSSFSVVESGGNGDTSQPCPTDVSCQKDSCGETATLASPLDFPLYQPKDVLERIALPPSWDLESLFMEASKPAVTSKSINDIRLGKQISRRPSLPAFPWSHAFGGHCRTNSDAVKLSTNRSTCQGKWARIGVIASSTGIDHGCFTNLDSYGYDQSLVPSAGSSDNKVFPSLCASLPFCQWDSASLATSSKASQVSGEFEDQLDNNKTVTHGHCPRLFAAAQTLYDIATHLPRQNPGGIVRWQKKTSHKSMKARNPKSNDKTDETLSTPISVIGSDHMVRSLTPSKKPRLSIVDRKDSVHFNNVKKGPTTWPTSKSSRSFSNKSVRDPVVENRHSTASILKQHSMMPPPSRVGDKSCDSQQKARKLVLMDWKRGRDKSD